MAKPEKYLRPSRAWQRMLSGRRLDLLNPSALDIEIEDIAHGLARVARWNGQTLGKHPFSVAQHCILVRDISLLLRPKLDPKWQLAALLHDAPEYVIGDMISPFKSALGLDYKTFENRLEQQIHIRFGVPKQLPNRIHDLIKRADRAAAYFEAVQLAGFDEAEAIKFFGRPRALTGLEFSLKPVSTKTSKAMFLKVFNELLKHVEST